MIVATIMTIITMVIITGIVVIISIIVVHLLSKRGNNALAFTPRFSCR